MPVYTFQSNTEALFLLSHVILKPLSVCWGLFRLCNLCRRTSVQTRWNKLPLEMETLAYFSVTVSVALCSNDNSEPIRWCQVSLLHMSRDRDACAMWRALKVKPSTSKEGSLQVDGAARGNICIRFFQGKPLPFLYTPRTHSRAVEAYNC